jgi:GntR family transcriptional regulator
VKYQPGNKGARVNRAKTNGQFGHLDDEMRPPGLRSFAARPLTERVREELARSIRDGLFEAGWLPSEPELAEKLSVSRATVRAALRSLEEEGLITRLRGRGTRINTHVVPGPSLSRVVGMYDLIREAGYEPVIDTTALEITTAAPLCVERLKCPEDTEMLMIDRRFLADGRPAILIREMVLASHLKRLVRADEVPNSIFEFADLFCISPVEHSVVEIASARPSARLAGLLGLRRGDPCLNLIETHYSPDGYPFIASDIYLVDKYIRFIVVRRRF